MSQVLKGTIASEGIAVAPVKIIEDIDLSFDRVEISDVKKEIFRFEEAVFVAKQDIEKVRNKAADNIDEERAAIFDAQLLFLEDPEFIGQIKSQIESTYVNAESALDDVSNMFISIFSAMEDNPYMQERAKDIEDVSKRLLANLLGKEDLGISNISEESILLAEDLSPSETSQLNKNLVQAFLTEVGGRTSHSAIIARSLGIPAIVGLSNLRSKVNDGDIVIVDAEEGLVILNPSEEEIKIYKHKREEYLHNKNELLKLKDKNTVSKDGVQVELGANIAGPEDIENALLNGAEAIGLFRTEFLYMKDDRLPSEEEQFEAYKQVLVGMQNRPVVIRTMDIGGDKELPSLSLEKELNPFLGHRAIRISLEKEDIFRTQLRALLRASAFGNLKVMFPMIATISEFRQAKKFLLEEKSKLEGEEVKLGEVEVGIMIEIPAAAILAEQFAKEVDFFSVGTNDLIQYTMAADRMNEKVSYLYQPLNPAIIRLLQNVIASAHKEGKWVGMCGEMAGDERAVPLLLGLGLDEFSMSAGNILKIRELISRLDKKDCETLVQKVIKDCSSEEDVINLLAEK
ncbi:phosphoenolpyruvate--protein phosphotransferase [Fastidiosipila sanguinis]|uniref:Phosphoenolpyruvate-protein phosphotransferase n=1 Tax=Fastidiosipila sanguinis TaxID=236753 RepID=A0A2S0KMR6_9FIRM|nr:phosphoenolpyruvate--protein phosphotransferase [Fastidiosipila sanguinis]AVM42307.1 phosphoenolpyruvate--protein phosphotransferase [Fastidiosipila sanguinis]